MAYPKEKIDEVLAYLDEGHSARDAVVLLKLLIFRAHGAKFPMITRTTS